MLNLRDAQQEMPARWHLPPRGPLPCNGISGFLEKPSIYYHRYGRVLESRGCGVSPPRPDHQAAPGDPNRTVQFSLFRQSPVLCERASVDSGLKTQTCSGREMGQSRWTHVSPPAGEAGPARRPSRLNYMKHELRKATASQERA